MMDKTGLQSNKFKAFSLIEAMIILVLVSVGIMALVPLITKKTDVPRWVALKDDDGNVTTLAYGKENAGMTRIGFSSAAFPTAKMQVSGSMGTTNGVPYTSVMLGGTMDDMSGNYSFPAPDTLWDGYPLFRTKHYGDNSIVIGQGNISAVVNDTIKVGNKIDFSVNPIIIGSNLKYNSDTKVITFSSGGNTLMQVNEAPAAVGFTGKGVSLTGTIGTVLLAGGSYGCTLKDPSVDGHTFIADGYELESCTAFGLCTSPGSCTASDKRLKTIYGDYIKGTDEINRVTTYKYTYKNSSTSQVYAGVIAQKLTGIFDEALNKGEDGYYSVDKTPILYAMVNAVKAINASQKDIKKEQKELNKELDSLIDRAGKK
ncbi:MAG: tail fiber domain-containing protein [Candidatus Gastranaerophilales bacterium]|nr:tail fiber domain-containing protein [Candidatus Gastranaerophilales bacterium]